MRVKTLMRRLVDPHDARPTHNFFASPIKDIVMKAFIEILNRYGFVIFILLALIALYVISTR